MAVWLALLSPPETSPPAMLTGTLALTAFWSASAFDAASWAVSDFWAESWACPAPPQPIRQLDPADWVWLLLWSVLARLPAALSAPLVAVWLALLSPPWMSPPATFTGVLALVAFCSALALEAASWAVSDFCADSCA